LVPRRHRIVFAFTAVYVVAILFTSPVYVTEPILGTYADLLPLDWAYVGAEDDSRNQTSMSRRIGDAPAYHLALRQAEAGQVFSPYFVKALVGFDDGQWAVREGDKQRGELAAVLDISHETTESERYEITRETYVASEGRRMNYGRLYTPAVRPYPESGFSTWSNSTQYGGL
jgi:hypothetical protein